jgi:hypothetical protein
LGLPLWTEPFLTQLLKPQSGQGFIQISPFNFFFCFVPIITYPLITTFSALPTNLLTKNVVRGAFDYGNYAPRKFVKSIKPSSPQTEGDQRFQRPAKLWPTSPTCLSVEQ